MNQTYFTKQSKLTEEDVKKPKENYALERLSLELGVMKTIKPLIKAFSIYTKLKELSICHMDLTKLHF